MVAPASNNGSLAAPNGDHFCHAFHSKWLRDSRRRRRREENFEYVLEFCKIFEIFWGTVRGIPWVSRPAANKNHAEVLTGKEILAFSRNPENRKNVFRTFLGRLCVPLGLGVWFWGCWECQACFWRKNKNFCVQHDFILFYRNVSSGISHKWSKNIKTHPKSLLLKMWSPWKKWHLVHK